MKSAPSIALLGERPDARLGRAEPGTVTASARCLREAVRAALRESRRHRQLADMYRVLALGEEPENARSPQEIVKTSRT